MSRPGLYLPILVLALTVLLPSIFAEATPPVDKSFRVMLLSADKPLPSLYYDLDGVRTKLTAGTVNLSIPYKLPAGDSLKFYDQYPAPAKDSSAIPPKNPLAVVSLGELTPPVLILLSPAPAGSLLPLTAQCAPLSTETFPINSAEVINLSSHPAEIAFGHERFVLPPSENRVVNYGAAKNRGESFTFEATVINPDKSLKPPQSNEIYKEDGARMILILTDNKADPDALEIGFITNWVPPPVAKR